MTEAKGLAEELFSHSDEAKYWPNMHNCPYLAAEAKATLWSTSTKLLTCDNMFTSFTSLTKNNNFLKSKNI